MKHTGWLFAIGIVLIVSEPRFVFSASKEYMELEAQMRTMVEVQRKTSEDIGVLREKMNMLVQQTTESVNRVSAAVDKLDKSLQQQQAASDKCVDQLTGEAQPLRSELTELRARVDAVIKQLNEMNRSVQAAPATATGGGGRSSSSTTPR